VEHVRAQPRQRHTRPRILRDHQATFRRLYVFVVLNVGTRRIVHGNVTEHATAASTVQQFRAFVPGDQPQRFVIHDRDSTIRRECLDWLIVLNERHLRSVLHEWVAYSNQGRPHASLGPGIPDVPRDRLARPHGHQTPTDHRVVAAPILAGLHHEYRLERLAA